jgi:predicted nucleotidyltransferase
MDKETVKQKIKEAVCQLAQDAKVILFGSKARGTDNAETDWDILVLLNKPLVSFKEEQTIRHRLFDLE